MIAATLGLLWKGINALYEFNGKRLSNNETALKIKQLQSSNHKENQDLDLNLKKLDIKKKELENQKLEEELQELRRKNQQFLVSETGIEPEVLLPLPALHLSQENANNILEEYGELDVHAIFNLENKHQH